MAGLAHAYGGPHVLRAIDRITDERVILEADVHGTFVVRSGAWSFDAEGLAAVIAARGRLKVVPRRR